MSYSFPTSGNNQPTTFGSSNGSESSYNDNTTNEYYGEIAEFSYSDGYEQAVSDPGSSLAAFDIGSTDPVSWPQTASSSYLPYDIDNNLGSVTPTFPHSAL